MDDRALLTAWQDGDRDAGAQLFDRHFRAVARFFRNKTTADFDDLIQATFLGCLESIERFRGQASFRTYLFGIAHNVLCNHYRRRRRDEGIDFGVTSIWDLAPGPSQVAAQRLEHHRLLEGLRRIPLEHQVLLELYFWEGLTAGEIGAALAAPEGTIRTRLRRAKQMLGEAIQALAGGDGPGPDPEHDLDAWAQQVRPIVDGLDPEP